MARRRLQAAPTTRKVGTRQPKIRVAVVCEGSKTEPMYLKAVEAHSTNMLVELVVVNEPATSPKQIVERACRVRKDASRAAKKMGDPNEAIEHVWCVFDVDEHPNIKEACEQARTNDIEVAISNPSIEVWFLLHFQSQTAFLDRHTALTLLRGHLNAYDKTISNLLDLLDKYDTAKQRARDLDAKHAGDATEFPHNNPSSGLYHLIDALGANY